MRLPAIPEEIEQQIDRASSYGLQRSSEQDLTDILPSTIGVFEDVFIIIEHITQNTLVGLIKRLTSLKSTTVRIFIASWEDPNISTHLKKFFNLKLSETSVVSDMGAYVKHSVALKMEKYELVFRDPRPKRK